MDLPEFIDSLNEKNQIKLATELIEIGVPTWDKYVSKTPIEYTDSAVGMEHKIDNKLISKVLKLAIKINDRPKIISKLIYRNRLQKLYNEIREPIVALQDDDFEIPLKVELILLSAYNLIEFLNGKKISFTKENVIYISINQSIDSITQSGILNFDDTREIMNKYKNAR